MSTASEARLDALASRLFTALREGDHDTAEALFGPGATWGMNSGPRVPAAEVLARRRSQPGPVGDHTHEEIRRLVVDGAIVEQHVARWKDPGGEPRELAICAVVRVNDDELVTSFEEYYDATVLAPTALTVIDRVEEHVHSEYANVVADIVPTISRWDVQYAMLARTRRGLALEEVHDLAEATTYYRGTREAYQIVTSYHLKEVNTSWYSFHESMGQVTHVGEMDGVPPTGKDLFVPSAVLFPVWPDGIIGEIVWTRFDMAEIARGNTRLQPPPPTEVPYAPAAQMRNERLHQDFVRAWREGDVDAMVGVLDDENCSAIRTAEVGGRGRRTRVVSRTRDEHRRMFVEAGRPRSLRVTNLVIADWYVFAEYLLDQDVEGERRRRELAVLYPVSEEGRLIGLLAYGMDRS